MIVASRPSVSAAVEYIHTNEWHEVARVFESSNGWFSIAAGLVAIDESKTAIAQMKSAGVVPGDAYCSVGKHYIQEVDWRSNDHETALQAPQRLWSEFDARLLSTTEKRFLQAALAFEGYYHGLLDGRWGHGSQRALTEYSKATFDGQSPINSHVAFLVKITLDEWFNERWEYEYVDYLDLSLMLPTAKLSLVEDQGTLEMWKHNSSKITVVFDDLSSDRLQQVHSWIATQRDVLQEPYTMRTGRTWITSINKKTGSVYIRSELVAGSWSTVMIEADPSMRPTSSLISSSIRTGRPTSVILDEASSLLRFTTELTDAVIAETSGEEASEEHSRASLGETAPPLPHNGSDGSTGTGFYVTKDGIALTNAHVVNACTSVLVDGLPAEVLTKSSVFDLAAVQLAPPTATTMLQFARGDVALNSDVTVAGYPLHGLLGGLNVSRGSISAMKGLGGDESKVQITAPVQPGNSGGPVINRYGAVVGVVVSKLDTLALADATGDIAQNVNFAIRGSLAKAFLSSNGITYAEMSDLTPLSPEEAATKLNSATQLIECVR